MNKNGLKSSQKQYKLTKGKMKGKFSSIPNLPDKNKHCITKQKHGQVVVINTTKTFLFLIFTVPNL